MEKINWSLCVLVCLLDLAVLLVGSFLLPPVLVGAVMVTLTVLVLGLHGLALLQQILETLKGREARETEES